MDHKKIQLDKIDGSDLFKLKVETYTTTHIQSYHVIVTPYVTRFFLLTPWNYLVTPKIHDMIECE